MQRKKPDAYAWQKLINDILRIMSITQHQLAKEIGVAHNSIHGWLNGRTKPRPRYQLAIADYCLRQDIEDLFKKHNLENLIRQVKEIEQDFVTIKIPRNLLSGTLGSETIIEIDGVRYEITNSGAKHLKRIFPDNIVIVDPSLIK